MRKLKLQVQISVDGFIAGANGEMDWVAWNWDDKIKKYVGDLTEPVDFIILGRKLAAGFIPHWQGIASKPDSPEFEAGKKFTDTPKAVFTKTLTKSEWNNTVVVNGDLVEEVLKLKKQKGNDIIAYGGAGFASSLIKSGLVDEYHLFINPTAIGNGMAIFRSLERPQKLKLVNAIPFECGIVVLHYQRIEG